MPGAGAHTQPTKGGSDAKFAHHAFENQDLTIRRRHRATGVGHQLLRTTYDNAPRESAADEISRSNSRSSATSSRLATLPVQRHPCGAPGLSIRRLIRWITGADKARDEYEWWMAPVIEHDPEDYVRRSQV